MEPKDSIIHPLLESIENYGKTSLELVKLKVVNKTSETASSIGSRILLFISIVFFTLMVSIAAAFWLGELLGKTYYGFFILGAFYAVISIIIYMLHPKIKLKINDSIINNVLN